MKDLPKLDETLDQLEQQANILKQHNGILTKITQLSSDIEKGANELTSGNKNFGEVKKEIKESLENFNKQVMQLGKVNEQLAENFINANRNFHKEIEHSVSSKIERFNSEIQVVVRQERTQLQEALNITLTKQYNDFQTKYIDQNKKINTLKVLLIVSIIVTVIMGIITIIK